MNHEHEPPRHEQALMTHVERIVRPVVAPESEKLKMRRDLFAHVLDAYAHETESGVEQEQATRNAIERLGDPDATRQGLQDTVSLVDRCDFYADRFLRLKPGGSIAWHATKVWLSAAAFLTLLFLSLFWVSVSASSNPYRPMHAGLISLVTVVVSFTMFFPMVLLTSAYWSMLTSWRADRRRFWRVTVRLAAAVAALVAVGGAIGYSVTRDVANAFAVCRQLLIMAAVYTPVSLLTAWVDTYRRRGAGEWLALELDQEVAE